VVGTLVFSLVAGMSVRDTSGQAIANLEYERVTHDGPVFLGDTVHAETEILDKREASRGNRGIIYLETRAFNQRNEQVLTLRRRFLVPKRAD
jgi:acyl dehydratase